MTLSGSWHWTRHPPFTVGRWDGTIGGANLILHQLDNR
jgi:hypothetical protein